MVHDDVKALGASLVIISPQLAKYSKQVSKKHNLTFPVLSDHENQVATLFGLAFELPEDLRQVYRTFGIDLERFNGNDSWTLPISGRFVMDKHGGIMDVQVDPDYTKRPEPSEIITLLNA